MNSELREAQINELLYQAIETERGGIKIYEHAVLAAQNPDLKKEFTHYLEQTKRHEHVLRYVFDVLGLDTETMTPGREVIAHQGESLVKAIQMALANADPVAAELVACECVVLAETKDHANWELIGKVAQADSGERGETLQAAFDEVGREEGHHLYHSKGWCRESWINALGLPAIFPPLEEVIQAETTIGAARAERMREQVL